MNYLRYSIVLWNGLLLAGCAGCRQSSPAVLQPVGSASQVRKETMVEVNRMMAENDDEKIRTYIRDNSLPMQHFDDGYYGMIAQAGEGPFAKDGTTITLRVNIRLLNGEVCYAAKDIVFKPGQTTEIPGLHRVAAMLQKGTKARYIFPPLLAYGIYGDGKNIPPRSILEYEIEVLMVNDK